MDVDWDLQAVVRSCGSSSVTANTSTMDDLFSFFVPSPSINQQEEENLLSFPQYSETTTTINGDLEELYKPFFPMFQSLSPCRTLTSDSLSFGGIIEHQNQPQQTQKKIQPQRSLGGSAIAPSPATSSHPHTPRSKKRKNQQKRVVCQVPAEGLSSDIWAWRKYGQKPIKGSPYPRGYYRCSSSKGCLARKQVERSCSDPAMFIITFTAEHNHPAPTHRNSLAGSTRQKFSTSQSVSAIDANTATCKPSCSSSSPTSTTDLSSTTPLTESMEDEFLQQSKEETRENEEDEEVEKMVEEDELQFPDMVMNDDLFMGLEELAGPSNNIASVSTPTFDDCFSDNFPANFPRSWLPNTAATAGSGH